jgi:hypothetical protein
MRARQRKAFDRCTRTWLCILRRDGTRHHDGVPPALAPPLAPPCSRAQLVLHVHRKRPVDLIEHL